VRLSPRRARRSSDPGLLVDLRESFILESTLAVHGALALMRDAKRTGYRALLISVALGDPELYIERVRLRVSLGGHDIPDADILAGQQCVSANPILPFGIPDRLLQPRGKMQEMKLLQVGALALFFLPALEAQSAEPQTVIMKTTMGDIEATLYPAIAPATVANFLNYANKQAYDNTIFHRSVRGFIIQTGGYKFVDGKVSEIPQDAPVKNEFSLSNTRGTLSMAKLGDDPNSATNQFFFNLGDNSVNLNNQNGGFTVFGRVSSQAGLAIMDRLAAVSAPNPSPLASPFDSIPLLNYTSGEVKEENLLFVRSIRLVERPPQPSITTGGVIIPAAFGAAQVAAPGAFIEIYGDNLAGAVSRGWDVAKDFTNGRAPTSLEGVSVTVNGQPTYISYVSPTQLNVQIPPNVPTGEPLPIVVIHRGVSSNALRLPVLDQAGALLAPAAFKVGDKQYAAAIRPGTGLVFISNGAIPGLPAAPAERGETLVFYGTGFGLITGSTTSLGGDIAQGTSRLLAPVQFRFGNAAAQVSYAGLTPGLVGLYQFNVAVPADAPSGDVELQVTQAGKMIAQKLFISVR
jgi:uncharacterized protein (TIGR03437 family)